MKSMLFSPLTLRGVTFKNRIFVSPMCQYSSIDGMPNAWHLVHLGSRAVGGAACIIQEATAIVAEGRISPTDAGIWNDEQAVAYQPITKFIKENGSVPGIQLAHAGRKASVSAPWDGDAPVAPEKGGWAIVAPSAVPFGERSATPHALSKEEMRGVVDAFQMAVKRSITAGFEVIEIHAAHGYLLHEFLSPLSNKRTDEYGGSLDNRMRLTLEVAAAVRKSAPETMPVFVRISASDWVEGGWDIAQSVVLAAKLKDLGIDLIDASSGGIVGDAKIIVGPGFQVPFSSAIKKEANVATGAVGMIAEPTQAEEIIASGQADVISLAREFLRDPYWPLHAAQALDVEMAWPKQYARAPRKKKS
jgi:2,4-dienoyl-CoA reductase-like NADH-dependent reductase (Old Yellow Enzyme family)